MRANKFLFILGRGRSGTTLLSSILNAHPKVTVAAETPVFFSLKKKFNNSDISDSSEELLQLALNDHRIRVEAAWNLNEEKLRAGFQENPANNIDDFIAEIITSNEESSPEWIGQKFPSFSLKSKALTNLYPNGKFILLVRNPYDNVASYQKTKFEPSNNTGFLAKRWEQFNRLVINNVPARQLMVLKYEDFVTDPKESLKLIAQFIGIEFLDGWLDVNYVNPVFKTHPFYKRIHASIDKPIGKENIAKWKALLQAEDIATINSICKEQMTSLNYAIEVADHAIPVKNKLGALRSSIHSWLESLSYNLPIALRNKIALKYFENRKML